MRASVPLAGLDKWYAYIQSHDHKALWDLLHPDAVFDTGIWTDEVKRSRAAQYGKSVEQYRPCL